MQIADARATFSTNIKDCERRTGVPYITDEKIHEMIDKVAKEKGFNTNCVLNSKTLKVYVCSMKCNSEDVDTITPVLTNRGISKNTVMCLDNLFVFCFFLKNPSQLQSTACLYHCLNKK